MKKFIKGKIHIHTFIRIILVLLSVEFSIRIVEKFYFLYCDIIIQESEIIAEDSFRIICLGESTVAGHGASDFTFMKKTSKKAYPAQLEVLFTKKYYPKKIKVYNLGVVGIDTEQVFKNLKYNLKKYKPNLTILLAGTNRKVIPKFINKIPNLKSQLLFKLLKYMADLKIIRLFNLLYLHTKGCILGKHNKLFWLGKFYGRNYWPTNPGSEWVWDDIDKNLSYKETEKFEIEYDINKIINTIQKYNSKILLCNYFNSQINKSLKKIAIQKDIVFCDNEKIYFKYFKQNKTSEILCEDGWHPNDKGYRLMAENAYRVIINNGMIDKTN